MNPLRNMSKLIKYYKALCCCITQMNLFPPIVSVLLLNCFSCVLLFATPWTVAHQVPLSMGFPRQEYWSGLPFPSPEGLSNPGIKPGSPLSTELPSWRSLGSIRFDSWVGKIPWRRKWQPTPVFLPGKSHGQRSLVGYSPWGYKESDTT